MGPFLFMDGSPQERHKQNDAIRYRPFTWVYRHHRNTIDDAVIRAHVA